MADTPAHRNEFTGNAGLDRVQENVRSLIAYVKAVVAGLPSIVSLTLAADFTTTDATAQSTHLTFPVKAGEVWDVEYWGNAGCSNTNGMAYAIGAPTGSTASGWIETSSTNTSVTNWLTLQITAIDTLSAACHAGASNAGRPDRINVRVIAGADGAVTLKAASITAASTTTIAALAYLRATKAVKV